jgi:hypothetical protein
VQIADLRNKKRTVQNRLSEVRHAG